MAALMASFGRAHDTKNSFKNNDLPQMAQMAQMARQKWHGWDFGKMKKKKESERECNWNVNKPCRIVNQKTAKLAKRQDAWQFAHGNTA